MARAPNQKADEARKLFEKGLKLKEIAAQLNIPEGTVRSWKNRGKWKCNVADKKCNVANEKKRIPRKKKEPAADETDTVMEDAGLTDKQRLFCIYYVRCFNATKAYKKAFGCSYETAMASGSRMLRNVKVKKEIMSLKRDRLNQKLVSGSDIFQKYLDIAFADMNEYLEFGTEEAPVMSMYGPVKVKDPETGEETELKQTVNYVRFKDCKEVDGTILAEVKTEKGSAVVRLNDRMKALQWLSDHMGMATEEQKAKVAMLKAQTERLAAVPDAGEEDGVEIINDAEEKTGKNIGNSDSEVSADI